MDSFEELSNEQIGPGDCNGLLYTTVPSFCQDAAKAGDDR